MYIKRLCLKNIRCFDEIEIDFKEDCHSALLLGDNGDGKCIVQPFAIIKGMIWLK